MKQCIGLVVLLLLSVTTFAQDLTRVEPPNWWAGMHHNNIQILVQGDDLGRSVTEVRILGEGMELRRVIKTDSPNYLFLEVTIAPDGAGTHTIEFWNGDKKWASHDYPVLAREEQTIDGFDASDAIYLITPDRFVNGDPKNDEVKGMREGLNRAFKGGRHGGDIEGIRKSLDYIQDLGFTAIWLNPLLENDMDSFSYHGYSTTDFYRVDTRYGSNEMYRAMAHEARDKGMKLIMDMIVNHIGSHHWWMYDKPTYDWINEWDEYTETNHLKTVYTDPYVSEIDRKTFADGWFVRTMPDLNQRNDLLGQYLIQNSIWWVEYLGLSGIRMDTYPYPDMDYMSEWTKAMMTEYPTLNIVGEEWIDDANIVSYWQAGKTNANGYTSSLKSVMDFPVQAEMVKALNEYESNFSGWVRLYKAIAKDYLYPDPMNLVIFPDNHDMSRIFTQVNEDYAYFKQAIAFTLTTRGIPQLYYGTEILMKNPGTNDHGIIRSDFPGGWKGDKINGFTGKGLTAQEKAAQAYIKQLLQWRKTATLVHTGHLKHFKPAEGFYVYFRYNDDGQKLMVVLNKNKEDRSLHLDRFREILPAGSQGVDVLTGQSYTLTGAITVPGGEPLILEL